MLQCDAIATSSEGAPRTTARKYLGRQVRIWLVGTRNSVYTTLSSPGYLLIEVVVTCSPADGL